MAKKRKNKNNFLASLRDKIIVKQARKISLSMAFIWEIFMLIAAINKDIVAEDEGIMFLVFAGIMVPVIIFFLFYCVLFQADDKTKLEYEKEKENDIRHQLSSYTDFQQVDLLLIEQFQFGEMNSFAEMLDCILTNEGCTFYAKLKDENTIEVYAKNKVGEIVYPHTDITNFQYFDKHFKVQETKP